MSREIGELETISLSQNAIVNVPRNVGIKRLTQDFVRFFNWMIRLLDNVFIQAGHCKALQRQITADCVGTTQNKKSLKSLPHDTQVNNRYSILMH